VVSLRLLIRRVGDIRRMGDTEGALGAHVGVGGTLPPLAWARQGLCFGLWDSDGDQMDGGILADQAVYVWDVCLHSTCLETP
jgi:hypothetical protein